MSLFPERSVKWKGTSTRTNTHTHTQRNEALYMTFADEASRSLMCVYSLYLPQPLHRICCFLSSARAIGCVRVCVHGAYPLNTTSIFWHVYISLLPTNPKFVTRIKNRGDTCHWWNWWFLLDCFGSVQSTTSCVYRLCGFGEQKVEYLTKWELCETPHTHRPDHLEIRQRQRDNRNNIPNHFVSNFFRATR